MSHDALIIADVELPNSDFLMRQVAQSPLIFVTDGAANKIEAGEKEIFACGDFDSINRIEVIEKHPNVQFVELADQNASDLEKTVQYAMERGVENAIIIGAFGGRIDHTLSNFSLLLRCHRTMKISYVDQEMEMLVLSPDCKRAGVWRADFKQGITISLAAYSPDVVISLSGVQWPLERSTLRFGTQGVSNRSLGGQVNLVVHSGTVALSFCHSR